MKKLSWILIITLLASCLSACGRKETVIYQGDTASTSDATDNPIRNLICTLFTGQPVRRVFYAL